MQNGSLIPRFQAKERKGEAGVERAQHLHRACLRSPEKCKKVSPVLHARRERKSTRFGINLRSGFS